MSTSNEFEQERSRWSEERRVLEEQKASFEARIQALETELEVNRKGKEAAEGETSSEPAVLQAELEVCLSIRATNTA